MLKSKIKIIVGSVLIGAVMCHAASADSASKVIDIGYNSSSFQGVNDSELLDIYSPKNIRLLRLGDGYNPDTNSFYPLNHMDSAQQTEDESYYTDVAAATGKMDKARKVTRVATMSKNWDNYVASSERSARENNTHAAAEGSFGYGLFSAAMAFDADVSKKSSSAKIDTSQTAGFVKGYTESFNIIDGNGNYLFSNIAAEHVREALEHIDPSLRKAINQVRRATNVKQREEAIADFYKNFGHQVVVSVDRSYLALASIHVMGKESSLDSSSSWGGSATLNYMGNGGKASFHNGSAASFKKSDVEVKFEKVAYPDIPENLTKLGDIVNAEAQKVAQSAMVELNQARQDMADKVSDTIAKQPVIPEAIIPEKIQKEVEARTEIVKAEQEHLQNLLTDEEISRFRQNCLEGDKGNLCTRTIVQAVYTKLNGSIIKDSMYIQDQKLIDRLDNIYRAVQIFQSYFISHAEDSLTDQELQKLKSDFTKIQANSEKMEQDAKDQTENKSNSRERAKQQAKYDFNAEIKYECAQKKHDGDQGCSLKEMDDYLKNVSIQDLLDKEKIFALGAYKFKTSLSQPDQIRQRNHLQHRAMISDSNQDPATTNFTSVNWNVLYPCLGVEKKNDDNILIKDKMLQVLKKYIDLAEYLRFESYVYNHYWHLVEPKATTLIDDFSNDMFGGRDKPKAPVGEAYTKIKDLYNNIIGSFNKRDDNLDQYNEILAKVNTMNSDIERFQDLVNQNESYRKSWEIASNLYGRGLLKPYGIVFQQQDQKDNDTYDTCTISLGLDTGHNGSWSSECYFDKKQPTRGISIPYNILAYGSDCGLGVAGCHDLYDTNGFGGIATYTILVNGETTIDSETNPKYIAHFDLYSNAWYRNQINHLSHDAIRILTANANDVSNDALLPFAFGNSDDHTKTSYPVMRIDLTNSSSSRYAIEFENDTTTNIKVKVGKIGFWSVATGSNDIGQIETHRSNASPNYFSDIYVADPLFDRSELYTDAAKEFKDSQDILKKLHVNYSYEDTLNDDRFMENINYWLNSN